MNVKKLEIFNNIVLLSNKDVNQDILRIDNIELLLKYLRQNLLLASQLKKNRLKSRSKPRIVLSFSDPHLMELATLIKKEVFVNEKINYKVTVMESKDFYMGVPRDTKLVVFIGNLDLRSVSFCLSQEILLINTVFPGAYKETNTYNLPLQLEQLSTLVWILLFYKNI